MAGFFDDLQSTMTNPLFLGGAGLLTGQGFGGAMQGMQLGNQMQVQRQKLAEQAQRKQAFEALMQKGGYDPQLMGLANAAGPDAGVDLLAKAYRDPLDTELTRAKIDKLRREAANGGEMPSNVREWQYFSNLPPEKQQQYLTMKRAEKYLDTGTAFVRPNPVDPSHPVSSMPKDVAGREYQEQLGQAQGKAAAAAPGDINAADSALSVINQIRADPGIDVGTGFTSYGNAIRGTKGYDFQNKVNQATSGAFLSAIQQLRGMGALSNAEGQTATQAITRMNTATSKSAFLEALKDYENVVMRGKQEAMRRLGGQQPTPQQPQQARPDPLGILGGN